MNLCATIIFGRNPMKKRIGLVIGTAALFIGLAGLNAATAGPGGGYGPGFCGNCGPGAGQALTAEELQAREQFMLETTDLRKQLAVKQSELRALMAQANPNEKKVAALTGEAFDLRTQLQQKAVERGISGQFGSGGCRQDGAWQGKRGGYGPRARNL
jgi:zinc resistance-associated protein